MSVRFRWEADVQSNQLGCLLNTESGRSDITIRVSGAAWVYRKYATDDSLYDLENKAHAEGLGLWALPEAQRVPPCKRKVES